MKVILESTMRIVELDLGNGMLAPARVWQGKTTGGDVVVPVHAFITRIVPEVHKSHPEVDRLTEAFERELKRCADPRPSVAVIPSRLII